MLNNTCLEAQRRLTGSVRRTTTMSPVLTPHLYHASRRLVLLQPTEMKIAVSTNAWDVSCPTYFMYDYFMEDLFLLMLSLFVFLS